MDFARQQQSGVNPQRASNCEDHRLCKIDYMTTAKIHLTKAGGYTLPQHRELRAGHGELEHSAALDQRDLLFDVGP